MTLPRIRPAAGVLCIILFGIVLGRAASTLVPWGDNFYGQTNIPPGLSDVVQIAGSSTHNLALSRNGAVAAWGWNSYGQTDIPPGLPYIQAVAAGSSHSLALSAAGNVAAWGWNYYGQTNVPEVSNVAAIAAGASHSLALRADGTLVGWGNNQDGQTNAPYGITNMVAVACGGWHSLAVGCNGRVAAWGYNGYGQTDVPAGLTNAVAVAAGATHSMALRADGTVVVWGNNDYGQRDVPARLDNIVDIVAGAYHCLALKADGTVAAWGYNGSGQTNVPAGLSNVVAIAPRSLALVGDGLPAPTAPLVNRMAAVGDCALFRMTASGQWPISYQWRHSGTNLPGATNTWLWLTNVQSAQAGLYSVQLSNSLGIVMTTAARLQVAPLWFNLQPESQARVIRETASFEAEVQSTVPVSYQWRVDGRLVVDDTRISGATTASLTISNVQFSDWGRYSLRASNAYGAITSQVAFLSVTSFPPVLTCQPQSQTVDASSNAAFSVCVESVYPEYSIQWMFNSTAIPEATSSNYPITYALPAHGGWYWCTVSNCDGVVTSAVALLTVNTYPPTILSNPQSATVVLESITNTAYYHLHVDAIGSPVLRYQWFVNGLASAWIGSRSDTLRMPLDQVLGAYDCQVVVSNDYGWTNSSMITMTFVYQPPVIVEDPVSRTMEWGDTNTFIVWAETGISSPHYQWLHGGLEIPSATNALLVLPNVTTNDAGDYWVIVRNGGGTVTSGVARLEILMDPPRFLQGPRNQSLQLGDLASFSCVVTGALPMFFQWRFNGQLLAGATNTSLAFQFTNLTQIGVYSVLASNLFGAATNGAALSSIVLGARPLLSNGDFRFFVTNQFGGACRIQASEDLRYWEDIFTFSNRQAVTPYTDPGANVNPRRFYRVVSP